MFRYINRPGTSWGLLSLCIALAIVLPRSALLGQGLFVVFNSPTEVAETNRSALAGPLFFVVESGTTGSGKIVVDYGVPIEDRGKVSPEDVEGLSIDEEETDLASGILTVQIPQGINTGELITLSGVRFDMVSAGVERVVANLRAAPGFGLFIRESSRSVEVISRVLPGLEVDLESDVVFIIPENFLSADDPDAGHSRGFL